MLKTFSAKLTVQLLLAMISFSSISLFAQSITATAITAGYTHSCAVINTGGVMCWGVSTGPLVLGDDVTIPFNVNGLASGVERVSAGNNFSCVLTTQGAVKCWGDNLEGSLGVGGGITESLLPLTAIGLDSGVSAITTGYEHACALTTTGMVKCWGNNNFSQTGQTRSDVPADVVGLNIAVSAIDAGESHTCALTVAGGVKCWGRSDFGLGDGVPAEWPFYWQPLPVDVVGLESGVVAVSAGASHTCALTAIGGVKCWGSNYYGQLGDGTTTNKPTAVDVIGLGSDVIAITAGGRHSCALTATGAVKCWGNNWDGQLGIGSPIAQSLIPVDVLGLDSGVLKMNAGNRHNCVLFANGGIKCWGSGALGQLGDGTGGIQTAPVWTRIIGDNDGDGVENALDAFPEDPAESLDTDNDGIGNNTDHDDDNDGTPDSVDADSLNAAIVIMKLNGTYKGTTIKDAVNVQ